MRLFMKTILLLTMFLYSIGLGVALAPFARNIQGQMIYHRTYIKSIESSYNNLPKMFLDEFNDMADGGIVKYEEDFRPVTIKDQPIEMQIMYPNAIGLTMSYLNKCDIFIRPGLDIASFRETLFHEYLHCFDYMHTQDPKDLMYYAEVPVDKEENIKYYAKDLKRKYYEPRFYRF